MRLAILCQEEPVFLGPFLRAVIRAHPERVVAVFLAGGGRRSAGERGGRLGSLRTFWRIMEPAGFFAALGVRLRARLLGRLDPRSVAGLARRLGIAVHRVGDPNGADFHGLLRRIAPDAVLNQCELLLKPEVLAIPRLGFLNRHASLLPRFRGRMACFWAHAAEPPSHGLTIHTVDAGVDTGPILLQRSFEDVDPAWPYPRVMRHILAGAADLFWQAAEAVERPGFRPTPQTPVDGPRRFPTLAEAGEYRRILRDRRAR